MKKIRNILICINLIFVLCFLAALFVPVERKDTLYSSTDASIYDKKYMIQMCIRDRTGCTENSQKGCNDSWTRSEDRTEYQDVYKRQVCGKRCHEKISRQ